MFLCLQAMAQVDLDYVEDYYNKQSLDSCLVPFNDSTREVKQIILIRHGKPDIQRNGWRTREEAKDFIKAYDSVNVESFKPSPLCANEITTEKIYYSNLRRARSTAEQIFEDQNKMIEDARFREFERKIMCFFNIKLPLSFWLITSRGLWILGFNNKGIETFREARQRAKDNAAYLAKQADDHNLVILVAHAFHNKYVAKYLKKSGWAQVKKGGRKYTAVNILAKPADE